jgi:hypothetical protein
VEIRKERGFPPRLEKASPTTLGFFTVPTGPIPRCEGYPDQGCENAQKRS